MASNRRAVLIYNPNAGRQASLPAPASLLSPATLRAENNGIETALIALRNALGAEPQVIAAESFDGLRNAARDAAQSEVSLVIAAGGDGTVRAVAEGITGSDSVLGILPRGTVNVLARELSIPLNQTAEAITIAVHGRTRALDTGRCNGDRNFLLMCSVGFDALAVASVNPDLKGVVGSPAYVLAGLAALSTYVPPVLTLRLDDTLVWSGQAFMIVAANTASYGGDFRLTPDASPDDGLLDICVMEATPGLLPVQTAAFLRQMSAVALGRPHADPDIHYFRARRFEITTGVPVATQIDGDVLGTTPLFAEIVPGALNIRVPNVGV